MLKDNINFPREKIFLQNTKMYRVHQKAGCLMQTIWDGGNRTHDSSEISTHMAHIQISSSTATDMAKGMKGTVYICVYESFN